MGKLQDFVRECIVECKTRAEINTQSKAEVLLDKFAGHLDDNGAGGGVSSWNDLTDKPFEEVTEEGYVLPETTAENVDGMGAITEPYNAMPTPGKVYKVMWNGVEYNCAAINSALMGDNYTTLGNTSAMGGEVATDDPFLIIFFSEEQAASSGAYIGIIPTDGSESMTLSIYGSVTTLTPIPEKFLPESTAKKAYFAIWHGNGLADGVTYNGIREAAEAGRVVYLTTPAGSITGVLCHIDIKGGTDPHYFIDPVMDSSGGIAIRLLAVNSDGTVKIVTAYLATDGSIN